MSKTSGRRRHRTRGQALVEFAMILPIFMLILAGVVDFGLMLYARMNVIAAARDGARVAVTMVKDPYNIPASVKHAVTAASNGLVVDANTTVTCVSMGVNGTPDGGSCDFLSGTAGNDPQPYDAVNATTTYTYNTFFVGFFLNIVHLPATITITTNVQMVIEPSPS